MLDPLSQVSVGSTQLGMRFPKTQRAKHPTYSADAQSLAFSISQVINTYFTVAVSQNSGHCSVPESLMVRRPCQRVDFSDDSKTVSGRLT